MRFKKVILLIVINLVIKFALADVSHNQDFPVSGLSIQALLEPTDSNVYHHVNVANCLFKTEAIAKPDIPLSWQARFFYFEY